VTTLSEESSRGLAIVVAGAGEMVEAFGIVGICLVSVPSAVER
jgi:hypothetical protein